VSAKVHSAVAPRTNDCRDSQCLPTPGPDESESPRRHSPPGGVLKTWRVGKRVFVTGDDTGAVAVCKPLNEVLAWWIRDWEYAEITGSGLNASVIRALGLVRSDDDDWVDGSVRINGRIWRRQIASAET
jgi:hypothetical protein